MQLSVVITTFNRPDLLKICLDSLREQTAAPDAYEVIVVDNAGDHACEKITNFYNFGYFYEQQIGISHGRNRGLKEAQGEWVLYFDDDTIIPPDLILEFLKYLPKVSGAAFGGRFRHWYLNTPPKWLALQQGVGRFPGRSRVFGVLPNDEYLIGCFFAVKVDVVTALSGFAPELGMIGEEVGWADEIELQRRLREQDFEVFYAPELVVEHLVQPWKCSLRGQLRYAYSHGKKIWVLGNESTTGLRLAGLIWDFTKITTYSLPVTLARWLFKHREWYWQNAFLQVGAKYAFSLGRYTRRWKVTTT